MCLYPRLIKNPKYKKNKKNGGHIPCMPNYNVEYVPIGCGQCIECRKQKANEWRIRLHEEIKVNKYAYFVTLTFSPEELEQLCNKYELKESNAVTGKAVRMFLERVRKKTKKSLKHWLITELGQDNTERIHLHGIIFSEYPITNEWLEELWKYGIADTGKYCNSRTINYIVKYVTKIDAKHKNFYPQIFCSKGIGSNYIDKFARKKHIFNGAETIEYYTLPNGTRLNLPIYYRNKLFTDDEREELWIHKIKKDTRYINGTEIQEASKNIKKVIQVITQAQKENKELGYGDCSNEWKKEDYNITLNMIKRQITK